MTAQLLLQATQDIKRAQQSEIEMMKNLFSRMEDLAEDRSKVIEEHKLAQQQYNILLSQLNFTMTKILSRLSEGGLNADELPKPGKNN